MRTMNLQGVDIVVRHVCAIDRTNISPATEKKPPKLILIMLGGAWINLEYPLAADTTDKAEALVNAQAAALSDAADLTRALQELKL